jgi:hypothetical protein
VLPRSPAAFVTIRIGWFIISAGTTIQFTETPDCLSFVPDDLSNGEAIYWTHCVNPHGSMTTSPADSASIPISRLGLFFLDVTAIPSYRLLTPYALDWHRCLSFDKSIHLKHSFISCF